MLWVRFDPDHVPGCVERYTITGDDEQSEKLDLGEGVSAVALARGFGPGILGVRWGW